MPNHRHSSGKKQTQARAAPSKTAEEIAEIGRKRLTVLAEALHSAAASTAAGTAPSAPAGGAGAAVGRASGGGVAGAEAGEGAAIDGGPAGSASVAFGNAPPAAGALPAPARAEASRIVATYDGRTLGSMSKRHFSVVLAAHRQQVRAAATRGAPTPSPPELLPRSPAVAAVILARSTALAHRELARARPRDAMSTGRMALAMWLKRAFDALDKADRTEQTVDELAAGAANVLSRLASPESRGAPSGVQPLQVVLVLDALLTSLKELNPALRNGPHRLEQHVEDVTCTLCSALRDDPRDFADHIKMDARTVVNPIVVDSEFILRQLRAADTFCTHAEPMKLVWRVNPLIMLVVDRAANRPICVSLPDVLWLDASNKIDHAYDLTAVVCMSDGGSGSGGGGGGGGSGGAGGSTDPAPVGYVIYAYEARERRGPFWRYTADGRTQVELKLSMVDLEDVPEVQTTAVLALYERRSDLHGCRSLRAPLM
ncbi:hypothetical protein KFE25_001236 [Diacronema lutheri]|uniref:USP domain-containing protein n=1 Tax=Diacronema lutheri TaxID=2081491 RepID=A0A8J6C470_DIALT|nr:hypothetical protein KFE25_001236 [Diacronema lutheri]